MSKILESKTFKSLIFEVYNDKPDINLIEVNQTHSDIVVNSTDTVSNCEADGLITNSETIAIRTADCLPICIVGKDDYSIVHAGWRGIQSKIVQSKKIKEIKPTYAYIGPHIKVESFEVSEDFRDNFPNSSNFQKRSNKLYFNMQQEIIDQLKESYPNIVIEASTTCTFKNSEYNSYRRNKTTIRNWNILRRK